MTTFTDITEIKRAKEILKESESMCCLAVIVRDSSDVITLQDLKGNFLAWNPKAESLYGWSEAKALTMNITNMVPKNKREEELTKLNRLIGAEIMEPYRTQRFTIDGRIVDIWFTATALINETGEVYAIATTEREIKSENTETEIQA